MYLDKWNTKVRDLVTQGDLLQLLISEQSNVTWKSIIYGVNKGMMEFPMQQTSWQHQTILEDGTKLQTIAANVCQAKLPSS